MIKPLIRKALGQKTLGVIDYFPSPGLKNRFGGPFNGQEFQSRALFVVGGNPPESIRALEN